MEDTAVAAVPEGDDHDNVDDQEKDELFYCVFTLVFGSMTMPKTRNTKKSRYHLSSHSRQNWSTNQKVS